MTEKFFRGLYGAVLRERIKNPVELARAKAEEVNARRIATIMRTTTPEQRREKARKAGIASAESMSPEARKLRSLIARAVRRRTRTKAQVSAHNRKAAKARWAKMTPEQRTEALKNLKQWQKKPITTEGK